MKAKTGSPTSKLVLLCLAEHANGKTNACWPSVGLVAKETELCVRTVRYHLKRLEGLGFIARYKRSRKDTGQTSNKYLLMVGSCSPPLQSLQTEPEVEPSKSIIGAWREEKFEDFFEAYPKKDRRVEARFAFQASLSKTSPEILIKRAKAYAGAVRLIEDPQYIAAADRWLLGERWADETY